MEEIKTLYKQISDKKTFKERLAKKLFLNYRTVDNAFKINGKFKDKHLETVKYWINVQLNRDKVNNEMTVIDWEILR